MNQPTKHCPYCGEEILSVAIKCKHCGSMLGSAESSGGDSIDSKATILDLVKGMRLGGGRYEILRTLGQGGMGVVYLALDAQLDVNVALKMLPVQIAQNPRAIRMLKDEARLAMGLSHPNIMRLHNYEDDGQYQYLVMEFIDGETLEQRLEREGPMRESQVLELLPSICAGLEYAHSRKVLHRDLKPSNIMVTQEGEVKICDFGIARQVKDSMTRLTGTQTSGTLPYMSPEQLRGKPSDARSDIYSLGIVLYELLSGDVPFSSGDVTHQILKEAPAALKRVSGQMGKAVMRCLEKEPKGRFDHVQGLLTAIQSPPEPIRKRPPVPMEAPPAVERLTVKESPPVVRQKPASKEPPPAKSLEKRSAAPQKSSSGGLFGFLIWFVPLVSLIVVGGMVMNRMNKKPLPGTPVVTSRPIPTARPQVRPTPTPQPSKSSAWRVSGNQAVLTLPGGVTMEFVKIPAGIFMMGSPSNESGRDSDEGPRHKVTISQDFWMGKYEVTQEQWQAVMGNNPSNWKGNNLPVERVFWNDCQEFLHKLNTRVPNANLRLPSEAEWEYACRAGSTTRFSFGDDDGQLFWYANYCDASNTNNFSWQDKNHNDGYDKTAPVGSFKPNSWGLYDMHGNVWEWCEDWYHDSYNGAPSDGSAWVSPAGTVRVLRGGGWFFTPGVCRAADRGWLGPGLRDGTILGFRCVRTF